MIYVNKAYQASSLGGAIRASAKEGAMALVGAGAFGLLGKVGRFALATPIGRTVSNAIASSLGKVFSKLGGTNLLKTASTAMRGFLGKAMKGIASSPVGRYFGRQAPGTGGGNALSRWHNAMNAKYTWGAPPGGHWSQGVSHQLRTRWGLVGSGKELHHWAIPRGGWGKAIPNYIKNQPWNIKIADSRAAHAMIDTAFSARGVTPYPLLVRPWMAMPNWARATTVGAGIGIGYGISEGLDDE